jgi:DUF4097 and DUF4098 domain-containing protein YvlB
MRLKISLLTLSLLFAAQLSFAAATGSFHRSLNVTGVPDVDVMTGSGNITVRPGTSGKVEVHARIKASENWLSGGLSAEERVRRIEADPPVKQNGNIISIGRIEDRELRQHVSIDYELSVPEGTRLNSQTGSGDQDIANVKGPLRASTGSGNVRAANLTGDPRLETGSGDIKIDTASGRLYARTGSGNIIAKNVSGGLMAETGSGDIEFDQTGSGSVSAHTGSGNIRLNGVKGGLEAETGSGDVDVTGEATSAWEIHTGSGNVDLRLPQSANFELKAESSSGTIEMRRPITVQGIMKRNRVEGKVGSGGPLLTLHTGSGDIHLD